MREISCMAVTQAVKELFIKANNVLPDEITALLRSAAESETEMPAKSALANLCDNIVAASETGVPVCQDTGMAFVFVKLGQEVRITGGDFNDAVNSGVAAAYTEGYLRKSVVSPLTRVNTGDNTPAVIYLSLVPGDRVEITAVPKGFGSENMSAVRMMTPTSSADDIVAFVRDTVASAGGRPCPPLVIGVGIGGSFDYAPFLAKKALSRDGANPDKDIAALEERITAAVNETGVGAQGFGGRITALKTAIETYPTHIASLPVACNISCHVTRHATAVL